MNKKKAAVQGGLIMTALLLAGLFTVTWAADAPKWVAVLYVRAQKAVGLRWMPVAGATEYQVLRSTTEGKDHEKIATVKQPQHFDTDIEAGTTYYYILKSVAGTDVSGPSQEKKVSVPGKKGAEMKPPRITGVRAQSSTEFGKTTYKTDVTWEKVGGAISYNVYRREAGTSQYHLVTSTSSTRAIDTSVEAGKTYEYAVTALGGDFRETGYGGAGSAVGAPPSSRPPDEAAIAGDFDELWVIQKAPTDIQSPAAGTPALRGWSGKQQPSSAAQVTVRKAKRRKRSKRVKLKVAGRSSEVLWARTKGDGPSFKFREPYDVELDDAGDELFFTSNATGEVYVLNTKDGSMLRTFGGKGSEPAQMLSPLGLDVSSNGDVYVADRDKRTIQVYSTAGVFKKEIKLIPPPKHVAACPQDVVVDDSTGNIYVADRCVDRIWVLDSAGEFQHFIGEPGFEVGQLKSPLYIKLNKDGNLVVINGSKTRIDSYTTKGEHLRSWGGKAPKAGAFIFIAGFDYDREGNILVADKSSYMIQGFLPDGRYLYNLADETGEKGAALFTPKAIAVDSNNVLYVVEGLVDRVQALQITGAVPEPQQPPPGNVRPTVTPPLKRPERSPAPRPAPPAPSLAETEAPGTGEMRAVLSDTEYVPLPLQHTEVNATVAGYIASVLVTQQYRNPFDAKIEAVYVFPLPQNGAVTDFVMTVGERRIRGIIRERAEAQRIYREAKRRGYVASLLTQERPNIFTQKVANIEPGKKIDIEIAYFSTLAYADGEYTFVFPMVVGPRYNPPGSRNGIGAVGRGSSGASGQPTEVPYLKPGERSGHDIMVSVEIEAGVEIEKITSRSHAVEVEKRGPTGARIRLTPADTLPNKDFVLRYRVGGKKVKGALMIERDDRGGYFTLMLQPPPNLEDLPRAPQEMVFVLDCSGSMNGWPISKAKAAARRALEMLGPGDTFQIIRFSNNASALGPAPLPATPENIARGIAYLESLKGSGGTRMIEGIRAALDFPHDEHRLRVVSFMTDGYIGNEGDILNAIEEKLGASRIFSFGVGSSVNRYLLDRMAKVGNGAVAYIGPRDSDTEAVDQFYRRARHAAFTYIDVDWGNMEVTDLYPSRIPDLFAGRPVIVTGRFRGRGETTVRVSGLTGGERQSFDLPVNMDSREAQHRGIARVWARTKIANLMDRLATGGPDDLGDEIRATALAYGLVSAYTAFVAVDSTRRTEGSFGTTVPVPVPVPEGVRYDTTVQE